MTDAPLSILDLFPEMRALIRALLVMPRDRLRWKQTCTLMRNDDAAYPPPVPEGVHKLVTKIVRCRDDSPGATYAQQYMVHWMEAGPDWTQWFNQWPYFDVPAYHMDANEYAVGMTFGWGIVMSSKVQYNRKIELRILVPCNTGCHSHCVTITCFTAAHVAHWEWGFWTTSCNACSLESECCTVDTPGMSLKEFLALIGDRLKAVVTHKKPNVIVADDMNENTRNNV